MAAADPNSGAESLGGAPPDVVGGGDAVFVEVDNWLGSSSFLLENQSQPQPEPSQTIVRRRVAASKRRGAARGRRKLPCPAGGARYGNRSVIVFLKSFVLLGITIYRLVA